MILAVSLIYKETTMKTTGITYIILSIVLFVSCKEDEEKPASIVGKWKGTLAEVQLKPFGLPTPVTREDDTFAAEIEFKSDGTVILLQNGQPIEGTYDVSGETLTTSLEFETDILDLTGNYTIEELTATNLVVFLEKEDETLTDPDSGFTVTGDLKATLHFERL